MVSQNQLLPKSGTVIVRTRATLARLMQVQKVSNAAWPLLGTINPSNLFAQRETKRIILLQNPAKQYVSFTQKTMRLNPNPTQFEINSKEEDDDVWRIAYVMVSPLSVTAKLFRVKNDRTSPAT